MQRHNPRALCYFSKANPQEGSEAIRAILGYSPSTGPGVQEPITEAQSTNHAAWQKCEAGSGGSFFAGILCCTGSSWLAIPARLSIRRMAIALL